MLKISVGLALLIVFTSGCTSKVMAPSEQPGFAGHAAGPQFTNPAIGFEREAGVSQSLGLINPEGYALKSITWAERGDRPCYFQARYHHVLNPDDVRVSNEINNCNFTGGIVNETFFVTSKKTVEAPLNGPVNNHFTNSLKVCNASRIVEVDEADTIENWVDANNIRGDVTVDRIRTVRLKGIELKAQPLNLDINTFTVDKKQRPNCEDWSGVSCPTGSYINNLNIRFIPEYSAQANGSQVAIGIEPICAKLVADLTP